MTSSAGINLEARGFQYKHGDRPLEGFTIQRAAGRGGFGEVYYAISDGGREVALKLIHTYEQIELRGISHCMNLKSPHLVTIFDIKYGVDGRPWVIMEFVSGPSLRELLDSSPSGLGVPKAAFFLREIAKGLTYLHDCGIVHRDLKPGNIFYENGYVKIGDYGLSKAILAGQHSAQTVTVGTVHYMAPEIGEGHYDKGIDLYALGALLYEMLTGQVPFFGASPTEVLMKHLSAQVDLTGIEEPFATVIRKAMAKKPAERYQSAQEMVEAVFGSEHVRNSVSHFAPESLSIVAAQVARRLPGDMAYVGSSSVTKQPAREVWGQLGERMHRLMNQGKEAALRPCRRWGRRLDRLLSETDGGDQPASGSAAETPADSPAAPTTLVDPISAPQRKALAAVAIGMIAIGTGLAGDNVNAAATTMFSLLAIVGGTLGVLFGARRIAPGLPAEPKLLSRLAVGGMAGLFVAIFSMPATMAGGRSARRMVESWLAIFICMMLLDWKRRTSRNRFGRVDLRRVAIALLFGAIAGVIVGGSAALSAGIVAGIALAVELVSPWNQQTFSLRGIESTRAQSQPAAASAANVPPMGMNPAPAPVFYSIAAASDAIPPATSTVQHNLSAVPPLRQVGTFARAVWTLGFIGAATLGLCLFGMLVTGAVHMNDEEAICSGLALASLPVAGFCLKRSFTTSFISFWPYLFRPLLQLACICSIVMSLCYLAIVNPHSRDLPPVIFCIVFPMVTLLALTLFFRTGGDMSQLTSSSIPAQAQPAPTSEEFLLARVAGGAGRLAGSIVGLAILLAAVLIALAVSADLPGLFNSNLVHPGLRDELRRQFGNSDWPRLVRILGSVASFILAVMAVAILMQVRRRNGLLHMLRPLVATALLLTSTLILAHGLPAWSDLQLTNNGWEMVDQYVQHVATRRAGWALAPLLAGLILLIWPAHRAAPARQMASAQEAGR